MVASFVSSASANATGLTLPTHQAGDLLIIAALRSGSNGIVSMPDAWTSVGVIAGLNSDNLTVGFCIAADAASVSGTWANAAFMACAVYRHADNYISLSQRSAQRSVLSGTNIPAYREKTIRTGNYTNSPNSDQMMQVSGVVVGIGGSVSTLHSIGVAPSGMTNRSTESGTNTQIAFHDTGIAVASWTHTTATLAGVIPWLTQTVEIIDTKIPKASSGVSGFTGLSGLTGRLGT